jgi:hypothetical protein
LIIYLFSVYACLYPLGKALNKALKLMLGVSMASTILY